MCADGWAGIGWPKEWGGQGRSAIEQFIFFDESMRAGAPVPMLTLNTVGPTIMNFGTDEQKEFFVPQHPRRRHPLLHRLLRARRRHRPRVAADPRGARRRRVRDQRPEDVDVASPSDADYCWLAVRTDPEATKHKGISMIIVPMDTPGITISPLHLIGTHDINAVFFDDVVVPAANVVGGREPRLEAHHQPAQPRAGHAVRERRDGAGAAPRSREYAQETKLPDGRRVIDQEWVQHNLAKLHTKVEVVRAHELAGRVGGDAGRPRHRPLLHAQGLRQRAQHGGLPAAHGDPRAGVVPRARRARARCCARGCSRAPAARSSSPSAVGSTRCNAT